MKTHFKLFSALVCIVLAALLTASLSAVVLAADEPTADIISLGFDTKTMTNSGTLGAPKIQAYSNFNTQNESNYAYVAEETYTLNGVSKTVPAFKKTTANQTMMLSFFDMKDAYLAAIKDGFSVETTIAMPDPTKGTAWTGNADCPTARFMFGSATQAAGWALLVDGDGHLRAYIRTTAGKQYGVSTHTFAEGDVLQIVYVFNGTDVKLYVNNVLEATIANASGFNPEASAFVDIGGDAYGGAYGNVQVGPMTFYSFNMYDTALTAAQVEKLYPAAPETTVETEPKETEPKETEPKETEPKETEPKETEPKETEPAETEPKETEPAETEPEKPAPTTGDGALALFPLLALTCLAAFTLFGAKKNA